MMDENSFTDEENRGERRLAQRFWIIVVTVAMNFYKYTVTPSLAEQSLHNSITVEFTRHATPKDFGNLILRAKLERDIYYHGQCTKR
ncbi:unnamed protein product [Heterobilharzia americana]|nr:unnamed protein product [Heterobilharzia americana]